MITIAINFLNIGYILGNVEKKEMVPLYWNIETLNLYWNNFEKR